MEQNNLLVREKLYEYHKHNLTYINDSIKFADSKSGILLTVNIALLSFVIKALKGIQFPINGFDSAIKDIIILFSLLCLSYSAFYFISVLFPRFPKNREYYMSWGGIANFTESEYVEKISSVSNEQFLKDMAKQNYDLAIVCTIKYEKLKVGIVSFIIGSILCGIFYIWS